MTAAMALLICLLAAPPLGGALACVYALPAAPSPGFPIIPFFLGSGVGILTAGVPALTLQRKRLLWGLLFVYVPSGAASYLVGVWAFRASNFPLSLIFAPPAGVVAIFLALCAAAGLLLPNVRPRGRSQVACVGCRYDLRGLPTRVCPECGHDNSVVEPLRNPHPENPYETGAQAKR